MVILLLGFLGSGRTSIGKLLAQELGYEFVELDEMVLKKTGFSSMDDAFEKQPSLWKEKELEATKEISQRNNLVVASSGAIVENDLNILYFKENQSGRLIVYLYTSPEELTERLTGLYDEFKKQGAQKVLERMKQHFTLRDALYSRAADMIVSTDDQIPEDVCGKIMEMVKK